MAGANAGAGGLCSRQGRCVYYLTQKASQHWWNGMVGRHVAGMACARTPGGLALSKPAANALCARLLRAAEHSVKGYHVEDTMA